MLIALLLSTVLASPPPFPVARAQEEFTAAVPQARAYCQSVAGDVKAFQRAALPFAPLDLQIRNATGDEADRLRNFWIGIVGAECSVDVAVLVQSFHCGERCGLARRAELLRKTQALGALVKDFRAVRNVQLLAQWAPGEWRVNDTFRMPDGTLKEALPSAVMGFVPAAGWKRWESIDAWAKASNVERAKVESLLRQIERLAVAAVVREGDTVRVVQVGIGDNESGLLFGPEKAKPPKIGDARPDGRRYVVIEPVAPGVVFYETT